MSVKVKSEIEKLESRYSLGADYIKKINHNVSYKFKEAYISKYVEYQNIIKYFELYIKSLEKFHEKHHRDIGKCPITDRTFKSIYKDSKHTLSIYKAELVNIKDKIANCTY